MRRIKDQAGFTLIELLIVLLVVSILSLALSNFIATWLIASGQANASSALQTNVETALDQITLDIELSGSAESSPHNNDPNAPSGGWQYGPTTLILAHIATNSSGNAIYVNSIYKYITVKDDYIYYLSGTTLYRRIISSGVSGDTAVTTCPPSLATATCPADKTIATGVTYWTAAYYNGDNSTTNTDGSAVTPAQARSIQPSLTITSTYDGHTINASYTTRMVFRNV